MILVLVVPVEPAFAHDAPTLLPTKLEFDATQAPKTCNDPVEFQWLLGRWVPSTVLTDDAGRRLGVRIQRTKGGGKQVDVALIDTDGTIIVEDHKTYQAQIECHRVLSVTAHVAARLLGALEPPPPRQPLACPVCPPPPAPSDQTRPPKRTPNMPERPQERLPNPLRANASRDRASVFAGPAVLVSPGGLSPSVQLVMGGHLPLRSRLSAVFWTFLPLTAGRVENANGAMTVRQLFFGAGIDIQLFDPDNPVMLAVGAGLGPMRLSFEGESSNPVLRDQTGSRWTAFAYGRVGLGFRLHPLFRLRFDTFVGPEFPEPVLRVAGREVAHAGRPAAFLALGAELIP